MRHAQTRNRGLLGEILKAMVWEMNNSLRSHDPVEVYRVASKWETFFQGLRINKNGNGFHRR